MSINIQCLIRNEGKTHFGALLLARFVGSSNGISLLDEQEHARLIFSLFLFRLDQTAAVPIPFSVRLALDFYFRLVM